MTRADASSLVFEALRHFGFQFHQRLLLGEDQATVSRALEKRIADEPDDNPIAAALLVLAEKKGLAVAANWCMNSFSTIDVAPMLAASLASTSMPEEYVNDVELPWQCFRIRIPPGVITRTESSILVHRAPGEKRILTFSTVGEIADEPQSCSLIRWSADMAELMRHNEANTVLPDAHKRAAAALHHIVAGVCVELATLPRKDPPPARGSMSLRKKGPPTAWVFELRRPVKIDCRPALLEYVREGKRSVKIQCLVRGHHKRQPCGPELSERKWIHVEPYWRGPEDAPIALRPHTFDGEEHVA